MAVQIPSVDQQSEFNKQPDSLMVALDIGTSSIVTIIAQQDYNDQTTLIGWGVAPSRGVKNGIIINQEQSVAAILASIGLAEEMASVAVQSVCVSISALQSKMFNSQASLVISGTEITGDDIDNIVEQAGKKVVASNHQILHLLPQYFAVDGQLGVDEPVGMIANNLDVSAHVITIQKSIVSNLMNTLSRINLTVKDIVLAPIASSYSSISQKAKQVGVCQIDCGESATSYCVFIDGMIVDSGVVPVGGANIIADIANVLHVSLEEARAIYLKHGNACISTVSRDNKDGGDEIDISESAADSDALLGCKKVSKTMLSAVIEARIDEIFSIIKQGLIDDNLYSRLGVGVVLSGGVGLLPGVVQLAHKVFELPIRVSRGSFIQGIHGDLKSPVYSCALGLLCYHLQSKIDGVNFSYIMDNMPKPNVLRKAIGLVQGIFV